MPCYGYIVSLTAFHEPGMVAPLSPFLRGGGLHYYNMELAKANPNGVQHIVAFVILFEGSWASRPTLSCRSISSPAR